MDGHKNELMTKQLFDLLTVHPTPTPAPQIRLANRRHCALYKFIYLLTYISNIVVTNTDVFS